MDAILTEKTMLTKPAKRNYQKEFLQRLDQKRVKECRRRSGKANYGRCFFKTHLEKTNIRPNSDQIITGKNPLLSQKQNALWKFIADIERSATATLRQIDPKIYI